MRKNLYLSILTFLFGLVPLTGFAGVGTPVNETSTLTWDFNLGTAGQTAIYSGTTSVYYSLDDVEVGSNWSYGGAKNWRDPDGTTLDTFTGFTPVEKHGTPDATDYVMFNIRPNTGLTFAPTTITFDCGKFGTSGGMIDVAWVSADGTETSLQTGINPARDKNASFPTFTHTVLDVSTLSLPASAGICKLKFYIYTLDPGKQVGIGNIIIDGTLSGTDITQTKVDETPTLTWNFEAGTDDQVAEYTASTVDYFNTDYVTVGSNWSYGGAKNWRDPDGTTLDTFTGFTPVEKHGTPDATDYVMFNIRPKANLTFSPDTITFDCGKFGTSGGMIDVAWVSADGTETSLLTGINPARDKNASFPTFTHTVIDVSSLSLGDSIGDCGLKFYIYTLDPGKQVGIGNVVVAGSLSGFMSNIESYTLTSAASPDTAGSVAIYPPGDAFDDGTEITLTASKNFGFDFSHWITGSGDSITSDNSFVFTISQDTTVNAVFEALNTYALDITVENGNAYMVSASVDPVVVDGKNMYEEGTVVTLVAAENDILTFTGWSTSETNDTINVTMDSDKSLTATYSAIDYIAGWDFYERGNNDRIADFSSSEANDTASLIIIKEDGTEGSWLDKSEVAAGGYEGKPAAVNWNALADKYYYQAKIITTGYSEITVSAEMLLNYNGYSKQKLEYSLDGVTFIPVDTVEIPDRKVWSDLTATLPQECNDAAVVYIRWIPDYTSSLLGSTSSNDGTAIAEIFITGTPIVPGPVLVANWKFDETTGTTLKEEINGADAEIIGAGTEWITGVDGNALDFSNAVDSISAIVDDSEKTSALNFTNESFTISLLAKYDPSVGEQTLFIKGDNGSDSPNGNGNRYTIQSKNGELRFAIDDDVVKTQLGVTPDEYPTNQWVHIVGVRDTEKDSLFLYMDGKELGRILDGTGDLDLDSMRVMIGNYQSKNGKIDGAIDDIRVYSSALSAEQIEELYSSYDIVYDYSGLTAYWGFDLDTEKSVVDFFGTSNGTIIDTVAHIDGYDGAGISFAGTADTSYIMVADNDTVNVDSTSFTIAAIVKFDINADPSNEYQVVFKGGTGHETITAKGTGETWETFGKWYTLAFKNGELRFAIDDDANKSQLGVNISEILPADEWVSIVAVRDMDEDSLKLYLNGTQIASMKDVTDTNIGTPGIPFIIGNNKNQNRAFNGGIDDLMMFNRALSAEEILDMAQTYGLDKELLKMNAEVTGIKVNGTDITPFIVDQKEYTVEIPAGTTDIVVEPALADVDATFDVTSNADSAIVVITAEDGVTKNEYKVFFTYINGVTNQIKDNTIVYTSNGKIIISGTTELVKAEVFDLNGKLLVVENQLGAEDAISIDAAASTSQILIVRLTGINDIATFKVVK